MCERRSEADKGGREDQMDYSTLEKREESRKQMGQVEEETRSPRTKYREERSFEAESARDKAWEEELEDRVRLRIEQAQSQQEKNEKKMGDLEVVMEKRKRKGNAAKDKKVPEVASPAKSRRRHGDVGLKT
ncbi:hypothetical protein BGX38DRAFT_1273649 [Terfezia claveryi]|nr:hypothetical protein BGX38DRAFT_1273649 [Terfezia claveryi]